MTFQYTIDQGLYTACKSGDLQAVKQFLDAGSDINWKNKNDRNLTSVITAIENRKTDVVKYIVDNTNLDIHKCNNSGSNYLMVASIVDNVYVLENCSEMDSVINVVNNDG